MANETWTEYQRLVLAELERHSNALEDMDKHLHKIEVEIAMLKIKAGVWGLLGGFIPVALAVALEALTKK